MFTIKNALLLSFLCFLLLDDRELNGHPDDDIKRQRNQVAYANELYNTMWTTPTQQQQPQQQGNPPPHSQQHHPHESKWVNPQPVKEEPKNNIPLPEILNNSSGSPQVCSKTSMAARLNLTRSHRNTFVKNTIYNVYLVFL